MTISAVLCSSVNERSKARLLDVCCMPVCILSVLTVVPSCSHCLTGNLALSASTSSFPPTLHWSVLQGCKVTHLLWSRRSTWHSLERKRKMFHEVTRER